MAVQAPPDAGKRLIAHVIDDLAAQDPGRTACVVGKGSEVADGFSNFTFKELAHSINYTSWWIEKNFGRSSKYYETLAYIGANDIRYLVFVVACNKTGYKPLLLSTRNSGEAHLHLLNVTECSRLVYTVERSQREALEIKNLRPSLETVQLPSTAEMLGTSTSPYPLTKSYQELESDPAFIIHSSGTTGLPKPIVLTNGLVGTLDKAAYLALPPGRQSAVPQNFGSDDLLLTTAPFFHLMGLFLLLETVLHGNKLLIAPGKPPSPVFMTELLNATKPTAVVLPPSILEDMSHSESAMDALGRLKFVFFAGAPLSSVIGDRINEVTRVITFIGSTEIGLIPTLIPENKEDWQYFEWHSECGVEMQPVGDGTFELAFIRGKDRSIQGIFHTFPDLTEYHTKDLFMPHPSRPNLWKYRGRLDDVVVLSNGEKFNPVSMEKVIEGHPLVSKCVIVGQARFQSALLIEPVWDLWNDDAPNRELIEQIWPTVQQANHVGPSHARIMKDKIGISSKNKPFKTTPKGTTQRRFVNLDYKDEIETIYANSEEAEDGVLDGGSLPRVREYVRGIVSRIADSSDLSDESNFFSAGFDSLQTIQLSKVLQSAVHASYPDKNYGALSTQKVYGNPTVEKLSQLVYSVVHGKKEIEISRRDRIDGLLQKYTADLPNKSLNVSSNTLDKHTVILTGSTGSLGNYILSGLLNDPSVVKVYCMNRSDAKERQAKSFEEKGLDFDPAAQAKVEFLKVSFGAEKFGLESAKYEEMLRSVDTVIHNAWRVDFNITVESFEDPHIRGVRHLIEFSLLSTHHAHIHFVSSISTVGGWKSAFGPAVPEIPLENCDVVLESGYGESKHVSERICLAASRKSGVPTTIHRVGQIAGPTAPQGEWNRQEWAPTIIATSKSMGKIPRSLGDWGIDWIPVDTLAKVILELIETRRGTQFDTRCAAFHLINPSVTTWGSLLPAIEKRYTNIKPIKFADWIRELEGIQNPSTEEITAKPAVKLLDFYRALLGGEGEGAMSAPVEIGMTKKASATMDSLGPISGELMENWLNQWNF